MISASATLTSRRLLICLKTSATIALTTMFIMAAAAIADPIAVAQDAPLFRIGSKKMTESIVLAEILKVRLDHAGWPTEHKAELGGTRILWSALVSGQLDAYPEYSGTLWTEILKRQGPVDLHQLRTALLEIGIHMSNPLGFNNTYALGVPEALAQSRGLQKISDLNAHRDLLFGFSNEFRRRQDGWLGLQAHYQLKGHDVRGLDHDIAYRAMRTGELHVTDLYSTDAEIRAENLRVLTDDRDFFPRYDALWLVRAERLQPPVASTLKELEGQIPESRMVALNHQARIQHRKPADIAREYWGETIAPILDTNTERAARIAQRSLEHLRLVGFSLLAAILVGVPLGISAFESPRWGRVVLAFVSGVQTIPSLALLVILIEPLHRVGLSGIGDPPALVALFLYSLLPIVRNTHAGLKQIPQSYREVAQAFGISATTRRWKLELPMALPSLLAGIKTAAVLNVGFATLGALVGAGGYGQPILTGIRLDHYGMILEGAIPSLIMALLLQQIFEFLESRLVSPGLRSRPT
jgi:osmoprotectant transport system permease protein